MHTLYQHLAGESLAEGLKRLEADIKAQPGNADRRAAFVQLLCLAGNWTRALTQLKSWLALKPQAKPTVTLLEQAIHGELQRIDVLAGREHPSMPEAQWPWLTHLAAALQEGDPARASALRNEALEAAEANPGVLTLTQGAEHNFGWLMDGDARLGPVCEAIVNGRYVWLPFSAIAQMQFQAPASVTDLVWRHTLVQLVDGSEQVCQIPARYLPEQDSDDRFLLTRTTEWQPLDEAGEHYQGQGQKVWLNDADEFPLLTLERLTFAAVDAEDTGHE